MPLSLCPVSQMENVPFFNPDLSQEEISEDIIEIGNSIEEDWNDCGDAGEESNDAERDADYVPSHRQYRTMRPECALTIPTNNIRERKGSIRTNQELGQIERSPIWQINGADLLNSWRQQTSPNCDVASVSRVLRRSIYATYVPSALVLWP